MSAFFVRRPIVAIVIAVLTVLIGLVCMLSLARRAVSGDRAAGNRRPDALHRRRRFNGRAISGRADRAEDERRR